MDQWTTLINILRRLTGQDAPLPADRSANLAAFCAGGSPLGYSQLNELLLLLGYDRVSQTFFQYLVDERTEYIPGAFIKDLDALERATERLTKLSLLLYGNTKFGFKTLSRDPTELRRVLSYLAPLPEDAFQARNNPITPIELVDAEDTPYLGYIIQREIRERLADHPNDPAAREAETRMNAVMAAGKRNHESYLASDHLDVYVATSMRRPQEYVAVSKLTQEIFSHPALTALKLRWFDPTQAYCPHRIDKGLSEALMLRRATCTIYLVQESDTLGKDSELASTLAQGKPVIAFVPLVDEAYVDEILAGADGEKRKRIILEQLRLLNPGLAWVDGDVRRWLIDPASWDEAAAGALLIHEMQAHYDRRAETLKEHHPLGIQVDLESGVANGVLVVRTVDQCAQLVKRIMTNSLEFTVETIQEDGQEYLLLRERISNSVYRVMTGDRMLTNAFWNYYIDQFTE